MTVRQSADQTLDVQLPQVVASVRKILDTDDIYKTSSERPSSSGSGINFYTYVQPNIPFVLGTHMYIQVEPHDIQTTIDVTVQSQTLIIGDAFGFYDRYIRNFFTSLNAVITSSQPLGEYTNPITWRMKPNSNVPSVVILLVIVVLYILLFNGLLLPFRGLAGLFFWLLLLVPTAALARMILNLWRKR